MRALEVQLDMDASGAFTISDVWLQLKWLFCLPGNIALELISAFPTASRFLELEASAATGFGDFYSWPALAISLAIWLIVGATIVQALDPFADERAKHRAIQSTYGR